jgi:predicted heme/steroid binding protein
VRPAQFVRLAAAVDAYRYNRKFSWRSERAQSLVDAYADCAEDFTSMVKADNVVNVLASLPADEKEFAEARQSLLVLAADIIHDALSKDDYSPTSPTDEAAEPIATSEDEQ